MSDGFWQKAFQIALLFAVIVMLGASMVVQNGALSEADVKEIVASEDVPDGEATGWPVDKSILPDFTPIAEL